MCHPVSCSLFFSLRNNNFPILSCKPSECRWCRVFLIPGSLEGSKIGDGGVGAVADAAGTMPCLETLMWVPSFASVTLSPGPIFVKTGFVPSPRTTPTLSPQLESDIVPSIPSLNISLSPFLIPPPPPFLPCPSSRSSLSSYPVPSPSCSSFLVNHHPLLLESIFDVSPCDTVTVQPQRLWHRRRGGASAAGDGADAPCLDRRQVVCRTCR